MKNILLLVVCKEVEESHRWQARLKALGHKEVRMVFDGEGAVDLLHTSLGIGCVITGTNISGLGGLGLIKAMRETPSWQRIPTLAVIEEGDEATISLAASLGASGYIEKPIKTDVLRKKLTFILAPRLEEVIE